jgi:NAD(P)-dependent dehydrogenase (short-subunit alcohol dehydrogenase family)
VTGRVVLIAGASRGIGREAALAFAARGDTVVAGSRTGAPIDAAVVERHLDVTDQTSVDEIVAHVLDRFGRIDVLVYNAGRSFRGSTEETFVS